MISKRVFTALFLPVSLTLYNGILSYFKAELAQFHLLSSIFIHNADSSLCSHISYSCSCSLMQWSSLLSICFSLSWIAWVPSSLLLFFFSSVLGYFCDPLSSFWVATGPWMAGSDSYQCTPQWQSFSYSHLIFYCSIYPFSQHSTRDTLKHEFSVIFKVILILSNCCQRRSLIDLFFFHMYHFAPVALRFLWLDCDHPVNSNDAMTSVINKCYAF